MAFLAWYPLSLFALGLCFVTCICWTTYQLLFHPLAKVPGPRLAALTSFYEFYYDCVLGGKFSVKVAQLHTRYGPIVRISPREVHVDDPLYFDQVYNITGRLDKDEWYYKAFGSRDAGFGTPNAELHRVRRKAISRFFSTSAIANLESSTRKNVALLKQRLTTLRQEKKPVNLSNVFRCVAADSVTGYCMPNPHYLLDSIDFAEDYNRQARTFSYIGICNRHIPIIVPIFMAMPRWVVKMSSTQGGVMAFDFQSDLAREAAMTANAEKRSDKSVLDGIVNSDLPEHEKTPDRLAQEARTLVGAGSETTGATLDTITYNILKNPSMKARLKNELNEAVSNGDDLTSNTTIKSLPYLSAVINEGLRLANSVSGRLSRLDPKNNRTYASYSLPAGTVISMNIRTLHTNPLAFPDPETFNPDRWLHSDSLELLHQNFAPFGRGTRSCIGKELALMNLHMTLANFFYYFDAELFETTDADLAMEHDFFAPFPHKDSKGLRVVLT